MPADPERLAAVFGKEKVGVFDPEAPSLPAALRDLPVVFPESLPEAAEVVRFVAREGLSILPAGAGEHLGRVAGQPRFDFALSTRRWSKIVEYEPGDMVMIVQAGVRLRDAEAAAAAHDQRLGPDPWPGRAATLGGAVAGNRAGLSGARWSQWRDVVLGARVLHADGSLSKTGGKVVKNVAGYDLSKLYVGSHGALAVLGEINLRLVPRPADSAFVVAEMERSRARDALLALYRSALAPAALLLVAGDALPGMALAPDRAAVCARFEGREASVRWQVQEMLRTTPGEEWTGERGSAAYDALRESAEPRGEGIVARIWSLPVDSPAVLDGLVASPAAWREGAAFVASFGVGRAHARLPGLAARDLRVLRSRLEALGARIEVEHSPSGSVPLQLTTVDAGLADLLGRTKRALDPEGRFAPLLAGGLP